MDAAGVCNTKSDLRSWVLTIEDTCIVVMQGNVILTDANYEILTLLRSHRDDDKGLVIMARHAYPIHSIRLRVPLQPEQLGAALEAADAKQTLKGKMARVSYHV